MNNQLIRAKIIPLSTQLSPLSLIFKRNRPYTYIRHFTNTLRRYEQPTNNFKASLTPPSQPHTLKLTPPPQLQSLPPITKATLLSQTDSKLSRMLIHIKWPLLRNTKTSTLDIVSAFISWLVMGNLLWIILGTTTFALMTMYSIHYFDNLYEKFTKEEGGKDESILGYITGKILSFGLGIKIQFEKGSILPELKDGKLRFKNVTVTSERNKHVVIDGKIEILDLTLSFNKWYEGNGLIYNLEIFGLNGKVYNNPEVEEVEEVIPRESLNISYKNHHDLHYQYDMDVQEEGIPTMIDTNYQFEHVLIHDSYLEIHHQGQPISINIFNCELPKLRGDNLLLDLFNANNASGTINNSMFTIHKRQIGELTEEERIVRFKLDAIDLGELSRNNPRSKFNWLINGKIEIIADIKLPVEQDYTKLANIISTIVNDVTTVDQQPEDSSLLKDAISAIYHTFNKPEQITPTSPYVLINVKVKLTDLKATLPKYLPLSKSQTPFISLTDLRSLINYINNETQPIIINTSVIEKISGLNNTKIFDFVIGDIYEELNKLVKLDEQRIISEKSSMWSHSIASQLLLLGLGVIV